MRTRRIGRLRAVLVALTAGVVGLPASAVAGEPPGSTPAEPATPIPAAASAEPGRLVTLITGDVVRVTGSGKDLQATVEVDAEPVGDVSFFRADDALYAVPGVAGMLLAKGALDLRLFDVTELLKVAEHSPESGFAETASGSTEVTTLPLIVQYAGKAAARRSSGAATPGDARATHELSSINAQAVGVERGEAGTFWGDVTTSSGARAQRGPAELVLTPGIEKIWLDGIVEAELDVSRGTVGAERAWAAGYDGTGVKVAVLDTGIDTDHPDLADRVVLEKSFVPGESPDDGHLHGTHVASIVAGSGVASDGRYAGVARGARLINGKVLSNAGSGAESGIIDGMEWAAANGADVVNMSLGSQAGSDGRLPMDLALNAISRAHDVLFVVAAGNNQNAAQSVSSPAAADQALAVANVERTGSSVHWSSSVGPRQGDNALKPEISAPGTDITAAAMGSDGYRALTGTSMASPHTAAAAAILAHKHPEWSAQRLKDTLVGTAVPTASDPIYWQGGGVVRADRAVDATVTSTATLNLGSVRYPQAPGQTVAGTVTFSNATDSALTLDLATTYQQAPRGFPRSATPFVPPAGSVLHPSQVVVPAGATAEVAVTVDVSRMPVASVYGRLVATVAGQSTPVTTSLLSWTREQQLHQLKLRSVDRDGLPTHTTQWSYMWLMDLQSNAAPRYVAYDDGVGYVQGMGYDPRLEPGRYALMGYIGGFGPGPRYPLKSWTMVAEPEIVLDQAREYTFDAREAGQVKLQTQRYTSGGMGESFLIRQTPSHYFSLWPGYALGGTVAPWADQVFTLQGGKATSGTFEWKNFTTLQGPPYILRTPGDRAPVPGRFPAGTNLHTIPRGDFDDVRLVDVGSATTPDLSTARLKGAVAVWHPTSDWDGYLRGAADDLAAAGARALVVVLPPDLRGASYGPAPGWKVSGAAAVVVVEHSDAASLLAAARRGGRADVDDAHPSPYAYHLVTRQLGGLTDGQVVRVREREMVRQDVRYHGDPGTFCSRHVVADRGNNPFMNFESSTPDTSHVCGLIRQEYFSPGVPFEVYRHSPGLAYLPTRPTVRWDNNQLARVYGEPGDRTTVEIGSGPWVPGYANQWLSWPYRPWATTGLLSGVPAFGFSPGWFTSGPDEWNFLNTRSTQFSAHARLLRDGQVVCESGYSLSNSDCPGTTAGRYLLELDVRQDRLPLSSETHSRWQFTMSEPPYQGAVAVQPVMMLDWDVETDLQARISSRRPAEVNVTPYFAKGFPTYRGDFTGTISVSHDDGATWKVADSDKADAGDDLEFRVAPPKTSNGYASYRVTVTDDHGNSIDQSVIRAAYAPAG